MARSRVMDRKLEVDGGQVIKEFEDTMDQVTQQVTQQADGSYRVVCTMGEMVFSPIQFNSFRVGPFTLEFRCSEAELEGKLGWATELLTKQFRRSFARQVDLFANYLKAADREVRGGDR